MLHQFLALAWLVSNRPLLLETSRDDVPETITRLKMKSEETVDVVFGIALTLQRLTPRRVCHVLREACYGGGVGGAPAEREVSRQCVDHRVSVLEGLKTAGIVMVDATQVAEIILASSPTDAVGEGSGGGAESNEGLCWGAAGNGGRFVLLDCRPQGVAETEAAIGAREKDAERRGVIWRRIKAKDYLGENPAALAELLREVSAPAPGVQAEEARVLPDMGRLVCLEASGHRSVENRAAAAAAATAATSNGSRNAPTGPCGSDAGRGGGSATHVCFVGTGKGGGGRTYGATVAAAGPPECRLALAASRSCLTSHVCVLEGGFPALEAALRQKRSESVNAPLKSGVATPLVSGGTVDDPSLSASPREGEGSNASRIGASVESFPRSGSDGTNLCGEATCVAVTGVSVVGQPEVGTAAVAADAGGSPARESSQSCPRETASSESLAPGGTRNASKESVVPLPPPLVTTPVQTLERKMTRPASSSKISEPFRAYAAKSADEMGRGLRSLPLTASKPLEVSTGGACRCLTAPRHDLDIRGVCVRYATPLEKLLLGPGSGTKCPFYIHIAGSVQTGIIFKARVLRQGVSYTEFMFSQNKCVSYGSSSKSQTKCNNFQFIMCCHLFRAWHSHQMYYFHFDLVGATAMFLE